MAKDKSIIEKFTDTMKGLADSASEALKSEEPPKADEAAAAYMPFAAEGLVADPMVPPVATQPARKKRKASKAAKQRAGKAAKKASVKKKAAGKTSTRKSAKTSVRARSTQRAKTSARNATRASASKRSKKTAKRRR